MKAFVLLMFAALMTLGATGSFAKQPEVCPLDELRKIETEGVAGHCWPCGCQAHCDEDLDPTPEGEAAPVKSDEPNAAVS